MLWFLAYRRSAAAAPSTPRRHQSVPVQLGPTKCGAGDIDSCEVPHICTLSEGCQCLYAATKNANGIRSGTCDCSAAKGLVALSVGGISTCGWDLNFGESKYFEVPRLGTVEIPLFIGKDNVCPEDGGKIIQAVNVDGASPMTCPRDADFVRLSYKRSGRWSSETCTPGQGAKYVLRTTMRTANRGDCFSIPLKTTDGRSRTIVFKYY